MIRRTLSENIHKDLLGKMVFISGPRQVGKTTLALMVGSDYFSGKYSYLNWDSREDRRVTLRGEVITGRTNH